MVAIMFPPGPAFNVFLLQYYGLKESDSIVRWFWKLVRSLKEEEKALLLKFSTGSPCVPAGGFASLQVNTHVTCRGVGRCFVMGGHQ